VHQGLVWGQSVRTLILTAAVMAALPLAAHGQGFPDDSMPLVKGYVEAFGGASWRSLDRRDAFGLVSTDRVHAATYGGAARAAIDLAPQWSAQGDAWIRRDNFSGEHCGPPAICTPASGFQQVWGVAGHVSRYDVGVPLFGALLSFGGNANSGDGSTTFVNSAGEVQYSIGPLTLYGQGGYVHSIAGALDADNARAWYVHAEVRYFKKQNLLFAGNLGFARYSLDDLSLPGPVLVTGRHSNILRWGARVEYKFDHAPVSLFAAYEGGLVRADEDYDGDGFENRIVDTRLTAGVHWWFQDGSLQLNLRTGARLVDWNPVFGHDSVAY
jgi:hypothetical protein